jgi:LysM repeat protein
MKKLRNVLIVTLLLTITFVLEAAAAPQPDLPNVAFIEGLVGHGQTYPLSCESRSAADLAGYWGVSVPEVGFFNNLPVSDNPEVGFVGSVYGAWGQTPPNPYGVHAAPVAKLLREYGLNAQARRGMTINELKTEIAEGRPVIVWVVGHVWNGLPIDYHAEDGSTVLVAQYEHTMIAYGYDLAGVYLMDAGNAARKGYSYSVFEESWAVLGNMAVTAEGEVGTIPEKPAASGQYVVQPGDYLVKLAREWEIDYLELAAINEIYYPYIIYPGQILLTGYETGSQSPAPTAKPTKEAVPTATPAEETTEAPTATPTPESETEVPVYVVQAGEHLMQIARKIEMNWEEIAAINGLTWPYVLYPDQVLMLSASTSTGPEATATVEPTQVPQSTYSGETYVIAAGEYLYSLAKRFGVNWQVLAAHNNISYPYIVYPGQVLEIP